MVANEYMLMEIVIQRDGQPNMSGKCKLKPQKSITSRLIRKAEAKGLHQMLTWLWENLYHSYTAK